MEFVIMLVLFLALDVAANLWGYDSRDKQLKNHWLSYEREAAVRATGHKQSQATGRRQPQPALIALALQPATRPLPNAGMRRTSISTGSYYGSRF